MVIENAPSCAHRRLRVPEQPVEEPREAARHKCKADTRRKVAKVGPVETPWQMAQHRILVPDEYEACRRPRDHGGLLAGPECADLIPAIDRGRGQIVSQTEIDGEVGPDVQVVHTVDLIRPPAGVSRRTGRLNVVIRKTEEEVPQLILASSKRVLREQKLAARRYYAGILLPAIPADLGAELNGISSDGAYKVIFALKDRLVSGFHADRNHPANLRELE